MGKTNIITKKVLMLIIFIWLLGVSNLLLFNELLKDNNNRLRTYYFNNEVIKNFNIEEIEKKFYTPYGRNFNSDFENMKDFNNFIKEIYIYEKNKYDCKFWSFVYYNFCENNNYNCEYVFTENHVFLIQKLNNGYCLIDGLNYDCYFLKN